MSDPTFALPERRSFTLPVLLAVAVLALAVGLAVYFYPATSVHASHVHTELLPTHTVFRSDSIVVGSAQSEDVLFVVSTVRIDNTTRIPVTLDDISCTFTDPAGAVLTSKAATRSELANEQTSFPQLRPLAADPLPRDTIIAPGQSAQGSIVFSFPFTKAQWDAGKSAIIQVGIYHGQSLTIDLPKP